jgi:phosphatidylethanolamine/phosphatidyl-N-methylethanolamine N-methyltransferase
MPADESPVSGSRLDMPASDALSFLMAWTMAPFRIGSVRPSSSSLAALMTREIGPETGPFLELGPGTGPFTRALLARGVREQDLTLFESDAHFAASLKRRFPGARIFEMDAASLRHLPLFDGPVVGAAISGLPFRLISPRKTRAILEGVFTNLRPGGALYQFTLGRRCPFDQALLESLDLEVERIGRTFRNFPPATIFSVSRIKSARTYDWRFA